MPAVKEGGEALLKLADFLQRLATTEEESDTPLATAEAA